MRETAPDKCDFQEGVGRMGKRHAAAVGRAVKRGPSAAGAGVLGSWRIAPHRASRIPAVGATGV